MKSKNPVCGVYRITSPIGMVYIGQSIDLRQRFVAYRGLQCRGQYALIASFKEFGVDSHKFEVIKKFNPGECMNECERFWQEKYFPRKSLNRNLVGTKTKKQIHIPETLKKISAGNKGKLKGIKHTKERVGRMVATRILKNTDKVQYTKPKLKNSGNKGYPILQLTKDGEFIREWENGYAAMRGLNINPCSIKRVIRGKQELAGGFKWDVKFEIHRYNTKNLIK